MGNQYYQNTEVEINLKELFWKILPQWKAVLLVSLAMALLVCGAKHMKDTQRYNAALEANEEKAQKVAMPAEEQISDVMNALSEDEKGAVNYMVRQKELANDYMEYFSKSILFNTDPTNQRTLSLSYDIKAEKPEDLSAIMNSLQIYITMDGLAEDIKDNIEPEADNLYISELIQFEGLNQKEPDFENGSDSINISIVLPEETDADAVSAATTASLKTYQYELSKKLPCSIENVGVQEAHIFNKDNADRKANSLYVVNNMNNNIKNADTALSDEQRAAVESIMTIKREAATNEVTEKSANNDDTLSADELIAPGWSKKYAILGFILGAFMYVILSSALLIFGGYVISASSAERNIGSRLLGEVYFKREKTGFLTKLLNSKIVDKWHYKGRSDSSKQIDKIVESIDAICTYNKRDDITILDMTDKNSNTSLLSNLIAEACKAKGIDIHCVNLKDEIYEKDISENSKVVISVDDKTKITKMNKVLELCRAYNVDLSGAVYSSEI